MGDKKPTMTVDEAFEGIKILVFKDAYTKEGIEITRERMMTLLESEDLMNQIEEMMQEKNKQIKTIMKINLPYFLLTDLANPLPEEIKMGFFTDNTIMGCSFDPDYDGYSVRSDNVLQQNFRWMLQDMDRDEFKIEQLPHFRYPKHIKDPNKLRSESNRRLSKKELAEFKKKTARWWKRGSFRLEDKEGKEVLTEKDKELMTKNVHAILKILNDMKNVHFEKNILLNAVSDWLIYHAKKGGHNKKEYLKHFVDALGMMFKSKDHY